MSLFPDDVIWYIDDPKDTTRKLVKSLELINEFGKVAVFKLIHRNMYSFLYSNNNNNKRLEREIKKIISLLIKNNKMPRNKFT